MDLLSKILDMYPDEGYIKADGFDAAIVGVSSTGCLVYSADKVIEILMSRNNWSYDDAIDYYYYNIEGAYVGDRTPIFINLIN